MLIISVSWNGNVLSFSISTLNLIEGTSWFSWSRITKRSLFTGHKTIASSAYLYQIIENFHIVGRILVSKYSMHILLSIGDEGIPIANPKVCVWKGPSILNTLSKTHRTKSSIKISELTGKSSLLTSIIRKFVANKKVIL